MITYEATVSVGCYQADKTAHCNHILYVTQPQYQESPATCSSSKISQQDIAFNNFQFCGITVPSVFRDSDPKIQFNVTGYIDGQYNKGIQRTTRLRLMSLENKVDLSGAWATITIPDIKVINTEWNLKSFMSITCITLRLNSIVSFVLVHVLQYIVRKILNALK